MSDKNKSPLITVFTPTYNRETSLPRLFDSLSRQDFRDFEWLLIDDGSEDGTASLAEAFALEASFPFRYIRRQNGGKHRAINAALAEARGEVFFIVDSDDALAEGALSLIARRWPEVAADQAACGLIGYKAHFDGGLLTSPFPEGLARATSHELRYVHGVQGDKAEVFATSLLRRYPFPEIEGERFITEDLVYNRIAKDGYHFLLLPEVLYLAEYLEGGLSARSLELRIENPRGAFLYYGELLKSGLPRKASLRASANARRISLHLARRGGLAEAGPRPRISLAGRLFGDLVYLSDRLNGRGKKVR